MEPNERVIQKSIELFTQLGIRGVTMDQIAEEVGMSKRTIYELFKDKDTLVWQCLETIDHQHRLEIQHIIDNASNVIEALYVMGQQGQKKKSLINPLFFNDIKKIYPNMWCNLSKRIKPGEGSFSYRILKQGIEEGIFLPDLNLEIVDIFIHIIMESWHQKDLFPENTSDQDLVKNVFIPYYLGISTEKGKNLIEQYLPLHLHSVTQ